MSKRTWKISSSDAGERLDVFLTDQLPDLTRSAIAKKLKADAGTVNGKPASVHTFLKDRDTVVFETDPPVRPALKKTLAKTKRPTPSIPFKDLIVKEADTWILLNKPAGLLVHPDSTHPDGTLADLFADAYPSVAKIGEDPRRPGIVHRLDKDVSGLMLVAKTQSAFDELKRQFAERKTKKTYLALVYGILPKQEGEIRFRIARSSSQPRMAARPESETEGRVAWTHYKVLKAFSNASLVECDIFSGRTHQIRVHLHALGCPVIGDSLYTQKRIKKIPSPRLMLQSIGLTFLDPKTQEPLSFAIDPDPAFDQVMKTLNI